MALNIPTMIEHSQDQQLIFDAVVVEAHKSHIDITKYPVESGFLVSDHAIRRNRLVNLEVVTANQHFRESDAMGNSPISDRVRGHFDVLNDLCLRGELVTVTTNLGVYTDCIITDVNIVQDPKTIMVMRGTVTLEQLFVVDKSEGRGFILNEAVGLVGSIANSIVSLFTADPKVRSPSLKDFLERSAARKHK